MHGPRNHDFSTRLHKKICKEFHAIFNLLKQQQVPKPPPRGRVPPYKGLMGANVPLDGVAFSIELLEWGREFSNFLG